ncbi:MAG: trehalose-6-phosphate synthase [Dehalococcoidia bacterium]|nr:trehalose-6-phosphate synthase [Dehalococcoidia bacterium]
MRSPYSNNPKNLGELGQQVLADKRLILVSNRGPIEYRAGGGDDHESQACYGSGGVAVALSAAARYAPVTWVASAMTDADRQVAQRSEDNIIGGDSEEHPWRVRFVVVPDGVYERYYNLVSNPVLWFLQHSLWKRLERPSLWHDIQEAWEQGYVPVNRRFAEAVLAELQMADTAPCVMFHDYHLYLAPLYVRAQAPEAILTHFIHIPWPPPETWQQLPWDVTEDICRGLLANDVVGFQTADSAHNFLATCERFVAGAEVRFDPDEASIRLSGHLTKVRHHPISVDVAELGRRMASPEVEAYRHKLAPLRGRYTIVRVDRVDPSKNIVAGFKAFDLLLQRHPELIGQVKFLALLVPSRTGIPEYRRYTEEVLTAIRDINSRYQRAGWRPIELLYENSYPQALAAMSLYDVLLVNSLADGMNLVSKEGPIVNERDGVLVLSRAAGSHAELGEHALSVDPTDIEGTAEALASALSMPEAERRARASRLRQTIGRNDLAVWLGNQLEDVRSVALERGVRSTASVAR